MMSVLQQNFFQLFGLPAQYAIDGQALAQAYQQLQRQYHPDRFVSAAPQQQRESLQIATYANEAYQTLKQDSARARYLLQLQGIDTLDESNTAMPADFLLLQMEWREALEDAKHARDLSALLDLSGGIQQQAAQIKQQLQHSFEQQDWIQAAGLLRELSFIDKILSDIQYTAEQL